MKKGLLGLLLLPLAVFGQAGRDARLEKILYSLGQIGSATYHLLAESYDPGDTIPSRYRHFEKEYDNPADTTIGASFLSFDGTDTTRFEWGYDGVVRAMTAHEEKMVAIDDFTAHPLPFRPVSPPFFNYAKSIIRYALTTGDRIRTELQDEGDSYLFRLTIDEERQIEFFGKAFRMPEQAGMPGAASIYEIWIDKSNDLPFKIRREMAHNTSVSTVYGVQTSREATALRLEEYFPAGYQVRKAGQRHKERPEPGILGKPASAWTLLDAKGKTLSLSDLKSRVVLLNFTGIGCGACFTAIPFLNELKSRFPAGELDVAAIETWKKPAHSLQNYADRNRLNYPLLAGTNECIEAYLPDNAVPVFVLLDEQRTVRAVFNGYGEGMTDESVTAAIEQLLQRH